MRFELSLPVPPRVLSGCVRWCNGLKRRSISASQLEECAIPNVIRVRALSDEGTAAPKRFVHSWTKLARQGERALAIAQQLGVHE